MKVKIYTILENYEALQVLKEPFRNKVRDNTGWSGSTFYTRIKGATPMTKLELEYLMTEFKNFQQKLKILNEPANA